jgi:hypothetical protein
MIPATIPLAINPTFWKPKLCQSNIAASPCAAHRPPAAREAQRFVVVLPNFRAI